MKDNSINMYHPLSITDSVYYVGVNDRRKSLFENQWPLPCGVSYNSYLIVDEKVALIDTVDIGLADIILKKIESVLNGKTIDYLIINHMEPDHSGSIRVIRERYPNIRLVGNAKTLDMLNGYFGITDGVQEIKDGDELDLGNRRLQFFLTPMIHWPETMMTFDEIGKILFSGDAFGAFGALNGGVLDDAIDTNVFWDDMRRYYACIVGKYASPLQKALGKLQGIDMEYICSTHGPVWHQNIAHVLDLHRQWSLYQGVPGVVIAYGTMYGNSEQMAEAIAQGVVAGGVPEVKLYDVARTDSSFILSDIFKYSGLVVGSSTYMNDLLPGVDSLLRKIETRGVKNRIFAAFGSFTWAGVSIKKILPFAEQLQWEIVGNVEEKQALKPVKYEECVALGQQIAEKIKGK
ncbi:MAG: FprA family A-type flavoprotein [Dysgonamonadaceae bacterium]|jgi:flavorubredoxin|nr:FprA family A-type flavoprotein [Dysgonamonadaceae bacterium]